MGRIKSDESVTLSEEQLDAIYKRLGDTDPDDLATDLSVSTVTLAKAVAGLPVGRATAHRIAEFIETGSDDSEDKDEDEDEDEDEDD